ncbi:hypothetical protein [Halobacillus naozhouensis]|uniref:Uncharacterized protein n=1 Tax=Halobacillus naozhouensis TaxID=554880 RepID=A0ABY8J1K6_9BACI|nr:hypothetical protein [Halobacillus naozhouensis]WFT76240.1 hypothetical protein P9989_07720 [Halobacillus naozhouensis]
MDFTAIDDYLHKLYYADHYTELEESVREKITFTANEMLERHLETELITDKIVGLQSLYMIEGESEEFAMFKRQGVKNMKVGDLSFSFDNPNNISPEVVAIIKKKKAKSGVQAGIGRLI